MDNLKWIKEELKIELELESREYLYDLAYTGFSQLFYLKEQERLSKKRNSIELLIEE